MQLCPLGVLCRRVFFLEQWRTGVCAPDADHGGLPSARVLAHLPPQLASGGDSTSGFSLKALKAEPHRSAFRGAAEKVVAGGLSRRRPAMVGAVHPCASSSKPLQVLELHRTGPFPSPPEEVASLPAPFPSGGWWWGRRRRSSRGGFPGGRRGSVGAADPGGAGQAGRGPEPRENKKKSRERKPGSACAVSGFDTSATSTPPCSVSLGGRYRGRGARAYAAGGARGRCGVP